MFQITYALTHPKQAAGFTLIEISIVLVIIGLIVGGVLVGKDMIDMAGARSLSSQIEKIQVATMTFKLKYNCVPGDCKNANALGLGTNGDGNKVIDGPLINASSSGCFATSSNQCLTFNPYPGTSGNSRHAYLQGEQQYYWVHLANAGLIDGSYSARTPSGSALAASDMGEYFHKDSLDKAYLTVFTWGGRLYIRTGLTELGAQSNGHFQTPVLNAAQMNSIFSNYHDTIFISGSNAYETFYLTGQKVMPVGIWNHSALLSYLFPATYNYPAGGWDAACVVSDGSGGYKFNLENGGQCNLVWEIDY